MKNLLFVSISFPPKNDPECLQTARYFFYLQECGEFSTTVVTSKSPTLYMPKDDSLKRYVTGIQQLIEISIFENKALNFILRKLKLGDFLFPDSKMTFYWQWKKVLSEIKVAPDVIYSRSNPISSAFMALKLKEHYKCPWVLHLSDPWALSPLNESSGPQADRCLAAELKLLQQADIVTFTTHQTVELYSRRYPNLASKFKVLPNVYDPQDAVDVQLPPSKKIRVVYTGGLVGKRGVFFMEAVLELVKKEIPDYEKKIEFVFAGDMDRVNNVFFTKQLPGITHQGLLSYSKAKELSLTAHILLIVDNPTTSSGAVFFPSKLLDYFLTRRKIWAVTPAGSTTRTVLNGYNHEAFEHADVNGMATFLLKSIREFEENNVRYFLSDEIPIQYSAKSNAKELSDILLTVG
jgi:hypothetical protein